MSVLKVAAVLSSLLLSTIMAASPAPPSVPRAQQIKLVQTGRRKPDMTQQEYFDYRFQVHGNISAAVVPGYDPPYKYIQTHLSLSAFYPRQNTPPPPNANQPWVGRDDVTELFFRDEQHLLSTFAGNYTKNVVGPDVLNFGDVEAAMSFIAREKVISLTTDSSVPQDGDHDGRGSQGQGPGGKRDIDAGDSEVAYFFIAGKNGTKDGAALEATLTPLLVEELQKLRGDVWGLLANVGTQVQGFDPLAYFGGLGLHALTYKVFLKNKGSQTAVRQAQKDFFERAVGSIELGNSFALWGREGLVLDQGRGIGFDKRRQPKVLCS